MKKILTVLLSILLAASLNAQSPEKISYQAIVRDTNNVLLKNQIVGIKISILHDTAQNQPIYIETQTPKTNINGLMSLEIGSGSTVTGAFNAIDWSNGSFFIKTDIDPTGGETYTITSTHELMSVPYALYAKTAGNIIEHDTTFWKTNNDDDIYFNTGRIGIGTSSPSTQLEVVKNNSDLDGNISDAVLSIKNNNYSRYRTSTFSNISYRNSQVEGIRGRGTINSPKSVLPGDRVFGTYGLVYHNDQLIRKPISSIEYFVGETVPSGIITVSTLAPNASVREERLRINEHGNVGIGTTSPKSKLQIKDGDIFIEDFTSGVIMKSPNGQCWKMTVDNTGNPVFSSVTCPQ